MSCAGWKLHKTLETLYLVRQRARYERFNHLRWYNRRDGFKGHSIIHIWNMLYFENSGLVLVRVGTFEINCCRCVATMCGARIFICFQIEPPLQKLILLMCIIYYTSRVWPTTHFTILCSVLCACRMRVCIYDDYKESEQTNGPDTKHVSYGESEITVIKRKQKS